MTPQLLARYADRPLPRYTSYPTAPHFSAGFGDADYRGWLAALPAAQPVSIYVHVPFCRVMCWYCGCNTSVTRRETPVERYLDALQAEMTMVAKALPSRLPARFVHFGGGTPTLIPPTRFLETMERIRSGFALSDDAEVAIEIDPRTLEPEMVAALAQGGVNRASLGVQSFDPTVQRAINRVQSFEQTMAAADRLRAAGITDINFDLIYGLPHQTVASCIDTVERAVTLRPDRLSVFGYAHVPSFKPHQRKIDQAALPGGGERHAQAQAIAAALRAAGYVQVGLDHFALPDDSLAKAQAVGMLHRNFQGYTTDPCETLIGFGASSIGRLPQGYVQNAVIAGDYERRIEAGQLAAIKGRAFAGEDRLRAAIIERIMCDYRADLDDLCGRFGADAEALLEAAEPALEPLIADGIARREGHLVSVPEDAQPLVRVLAAAFDQYLGQGPARHSRAV
ncbi:MAG: oxygen-independent coproporphyrinogen III oxidase [Sphingomonadales bacterium]